MVRLSRFEPYGFLMGLLDDFGKKSGLDGVIGKQGWLRLKISYQSKCKIVKGNN